ncbi:hypothetical protein AAG906_010700 [Vitis piasezkii]
MGILLPRFIPPSHPCKLYHLKICTIGRNGYVVENSSSPGAFYKAMSKTHWELPMHLSSLQDLNLKDCPQLLSNFKIEISDVSQLKQLPLVPHYLYIRKCDSVESLLEEEILQTNMLTDFEINLLEGLEELCISISEGIPHLFLLQAQIAGAHPFISAETAFKGLSRIVVAQRGFAFQPTGT